MSKTSWLADLKVEKEAKDEDEEDEEEDRRNSLVSQSLSGSHRCGPTQGC